MEISKNLDSSKMRASIVDNTFRTMLHEVLEELESLVDLAPLPCLLLHEAAVNGRHDFVEILEVVRSLRDLLHQGGTCAPRVVVGGLVNFGLDLADVERVVTSLSVQRLDVVHGEIGELAADMIEIHFCDRLCEHARRLSGEAEDRTLLDERKVPYAK